MKHPDYPDIDFKPAIARYDWDQTYDVLEFVYLPEGFAGLIDLCGIPAFELMAIDRFTPYRYRWADQYSDIVYEFLKAFNFSPHNSINQRLLTDEAGEAIADDNGDNITVPNFELENTQTYNYEPILANFGEGKYQITGLIYQGYQEGLTGSINTINQAFHEITITEDNQEIDLNKILWGRWLKDDYFSSNNNRFCSNSLVISKLVNGVWTDFSPSFTDKPTWLLYNDIDTYFNNIKQQLIDYFQNIYTDYSVYQKNTITYDDAWQFVKITIPNIFPLHGYLKKIESPILLQGYFLSYPNTTLIHPDYFNQQEFYINTFVFLDEITSFNYEININIQTFPDYYINLHCLHRGNNNKWGTGETYEDIGDTPYFFGNNSEIYATINGYIDNNIEQIKEDETDELITELENTLLGLIPDTDYQNYLSLLPTNTYNFYDQSKIPSDAPLNGFNFIYDAEYPSETYHSARRFEVINNDENNIFIKNYGDGYLKEVTLNTWRRYVRDDLGYFSENINDYSNIIGNTYTLKNTGTGEPFSATVDSITSSRNKRANLTFSYEYKTRENPYNYVIEPANFSHIHTYELILIALGLGFVSPNTGRGSVVIEKNTVTSNIDLNINHTMEFSQEIFTELELNQIKSYKKNTGMTDQEYLDYLLQLKEQKESQ